MAHARAAIVAREEEPLIPTDWSITSNMSPANTERCN